MQYKTITEISQEFNLSIGQISKKLNTDISIISRISHNHYKISNELQERCLEAFNCYLKNDNLLNEINYLYLMEQYIKLESKFNALSSQYNELQHKFMIIKEILKNEI